MTDESLDVTLPAAAISTMLLIDRFGVHEVNVTQTLREALDMLARAHVGADVETGERVIQLLHRWHALIPKTETTTGH